MENETVKTFETYDKVEGMKPCRKIAIAHAVQINEPFRVNSLEGDYAQGKPGDYLMQGIEGELYICDKTIFANTYAWVQDKDKTKCTKCNGLGKIIGEKDPFDWEFCPVCTQGEPHD